MEPFSASFQALLQYFALPSESQLTIGAVIVPDRSNRTAHEFKEGENGLVALALAYADLLQPLSSSDDYMLPDSETILEEIGAVLSLMLTSNEPRYWRVDGLREAAAWKLLRRLSGLALEELNWSRTSPRTDLLRELCS